MTGPFWENQAMQEPKKHEGREQNTHEYHCHNSVSKGPKAKVLHYVNYTIALFFLSYGSMILSQTDVLSQNEDMKKW